METTAPRPPAVKFIFVTLTLAIMGFGLLIPVLPKLIVQFRGGDITSGSHTYGVIFTIYALMQFIGSPILGSLSDRFGRRRIILIATAGSAIDYVVMACAPSLGWLFVARTIAGFTAGVFATANAYIVDVTPPEKRAGAFGLLGGAFGIGFVFGPVLGGTLGDNEFWLRHFVITMLGDERAHWLSQHALRLPFWVAAGCSATNWLWGFFVLPESLKPENRRDFSWARANPFGALAALKNFPAVLGLVESYFLLMMAQSVTFSTWALYTDYRYHWSPQMVGFSLMFAGLLAGVFQAVLVRRIVPKLGETRSVLTGLGISCLGYLAYGSATQGWMIFVVIVFVCMAGVAGPALQSYISRHVPPNQQGAVQGVLGGLQSLGMIPGGLLATWSFGWAISPDRSFHVPGLAFYEAAFFVLIALVLVQRSFRKDAVAAAAKAA
jgi:DHA1 family tetracycline resistance protein-like MFS transporter